jgi:hypothetical protein
MGMTSEVAGTDPAAREIASDPVISGSRSKASLPSPPQLTNRN